MYTSLDVPFGEKSGKNRKSDGAGGGGGSSGCAGASGGGHSRNGGEEDDDGLAASGEDRSIKVRREKCRKNGGKIKNGRTKKRRCGEKNGKRFVEASGLVRLESLEG